MRAMVSAGEPSSARATNLACALRQSVIALRGAVWDCRAASELPIDLDRHDCGNVRYVERLKILRIDEDDLGLGPPGNQRQGVGDGAVGRCRTIHRDDNPKRCLQRGHICWPLTAAQPRRATGRRG